MKVTPKSSAVVSPTPSPMFFGVRGSSDNKTSPPPLIKLDVLSSIASPVQGECHHLFLQGRFLLHETGSAPWILGTISQLMKHLKTYAKARASASANIQARPRTAARKSETRFFRISFRASVVKKAEATNHTK